MTKRYRFVSFLSFRCFRLIVNILRMTKETIRNGRKGRVDLDSIPPSRMRTYRSQCNYAKYSPFEYSRFSVQLFTGYSESKQAH